VQDEQPQQEAPSDLRREAEQLRVVLEAAKDEAKRAADEVFALVRRTEDLMGERDAAQSRVAQLEEARDTLAGEFETLRGEREAVVAEAATAGALARQLRTELDEAVAERKDAESRLGSLVAERGGLLKRLGEARDERDRVSAELEAEADWEQRCKEREAQAACHEHEIRRLADRVAAFEAMEAELRAETGQLAEELQAAHGEAVRAQAELVRLAQATREFEEKAVADHARIAQTEEQSRAQAEALEASRRERASAAEEAGAAKERVQELEQDLRAAHAQRAVLQTQVDGALEECARERARAAELEQQYRAQIQEMEAQSDAAPIDSETQEAGEAGMDYEDLRARLADALASLSQERDRWTQVEGEHREQTEDFHELREAHVAVVTEAHAAGQRLHDLENELDEARALHADLEEQLGQARAERDRWAAAAASASPNDEAEALRGQLRTARDENVRARHALDRLVPAVKKLMADLAEARQRRGELARVLDAPTPVPAHVHEAALSEAETRRDREAQFQARLADAVAQRDRTQARLDVLRAEREEFAEAAAERDRIQARLDEVLAEREELAEAVAERDQIQARFDEVRAEREELAGAIETLRRTERVLQAERDVAQTSQTSLQTAVKALRAAAEREGEQLRAQLDTRLELDDLEDRMAEAVRERDLARGEADALRVALDSARQGLDSAALQLLPDEERAEREPAAAAEAGMPASSEPFDWQAFVAACQNRRLGEILRDDGTITQGQLDDALTAQAAAQHRKIGEILIRKGYTSEPFVVRGLAGQLGVPFMRLADCTFGIDAAQFLSAKMAKTHRCVPLRITDDEVTLAMANPLDVVAIDDITRVANRRVRVVAAPSSDVEAAIAECYGG